MPRLIVLVIMLLSLSALGAAALRAAIVPSRSNDERRLEPRFALHLDMRDVPARLRGPVLDAVQGAVVDRLLPKTSRFSIEVPAPDLLVVSLAERGEILGSIMRDLALVDRYPVPVQVDVWEDEP